jgi:hypothetical protein
MVWIGRCIRAILTAYGNITSVHSIFLPDLLRGY